MVEMWKSGKSGNLGCCSPVFWTRNLLKLYHRRKLKDKQRANSLRKRGRTMAMYDWNGNGNRNDMTDNFIEYQIYKDCTSNNSTPRSSTNTSGSGFWIVFIIACIVSAFSEGLGVLILIGYGLLKLMGM